MITADQMHTQRKHARQIDAAGAFFIFTIGENQPGLFAAADALPWKSVAGEAWTVDRGHGRIDARTIKTLPPTGRISGAVPAREAGVPRRALQLRHGGELLGAVAVLGITSLPPDQAGPGDLLAYLRGHWSIEMHHYVRDVVLGEDASRIGGAHRAMAAVRNTVAGILHLHRVPNIAAQLARQRPRSLPAPAAVSRPHHATGAERKPRRDLTAAPGRLAAGTRGALSGNHHMTSANTIRYQAEERTL